MSDLGHAWVAALDPSDFAALAERLAPFLPGAEPCAAESMLTCSQAAQRAVVHAETIRRAVRSGALPASKVGRSLRIAPTDFDAWLSGARDASLPQPLSRRQRAGGPRSAARRPLASALANIDRGAVNGR
jgi:excisionase family DNA binding protein